MTPTLREITPVGRRVGWLVVAMFVAISMLILADASRPTAANAQDGEESCGTDLAMVLDSSGSIDPGELQTMKDAFGLMVDAFLPATPSELAVVDFDRKARVLQDFTSDVSAINTAIDAIETGGRTNWQDAIRDARRLFPHGDKPDLIVFASDGRPNKVSGTSMFNRRIALEKAINQANKAKAAGIRIIAIGIGDRLRVDKLEAIASSPSDVYTTDFDMLAETLADLAAALCPSTITVNKVIDGDGDLATTDDQTPGEGWTFTPDVTGGTADPSPGVTDASGSVTFTLTPGDAVVSIAESISNPWTLLDASCTGAPDNGAWDGVDSVDGIVTTIDGTVTCTFYNFDETPPTS